MDYEIIGKVKLELSIARNKIRNIRKRIEISSVPHMNEEAAERLKHEYENSTCVLEYGGGASTLLALRSSINYLFTVESDKSFVMALTKRATHVRTTIEGCNTKFFPVYQEIGPVGSWGRPMRKDSKTIQRFPKYATDVWKLINGEGVNPDFVLVDGRFRVACVVATIMEAKRIPGVGLPLIWVDDFVGRKSKYKVIEELLYKPEIVANRALVGRPKINLQLETLQNLFKQYGSTPD